MNENKLLYHSIGCSKRTVINNLIPAIILGVCGIFPLMFLIKDKISFDGGETYYVISNQGKEDLPLIIFIHAIICLIFISRIFIFCKNELKMYDKYMEFSVYPILVSMGMANRNYAKTVRVEYSDIIDFKRQDRTSTIYLNTTSKQYRVLCKDINEVAEILNKQIALYKN